MRPPRGAEKRFWLITMPGDRGHEPRKPTLHVPAPEPEAVDIMLDVDNPHLRAADVRVRRANDAKRLDERDARYAVDTRTPAQVYLGEPPPGRSALDMKRRKESG